MQPRCSISAVNEVNQIMLKKAVAVLNAFEMIAVCEMQRRMQGCNKVQSIDTKMQLKHSSVQITLLPLLHHPKHYVDK